MKHYMTISALVLTGAMLMTACGDTYRVVGDKVGDAWGSGKTIQEREVK